jgi:hypothetical protein
MQSKFQEFVTSMASISQIYFHILTKERQRQNALPMWRRFFGQNSSKSNICMQALAKMSDLDIANITEEALGYTLPQFQESGSTVQEPLQAESKDDSQILQRFPRSATSSATNSTHDAPPPTNTNMKAMASLVDEAALSRVPVEDVSIVESGHELVRVFQSKETESEVLKSQNQGPGPQSIFELQEIVVQSSAALPMQSRVEPIFRKAVAPKRFVAPQIPSSNRMASSHSSAMPLNMAPRLRLSEIIAVTASSTTLTSSAPADFESNHAADTQLSPTSPQALSHSPFIAQQVFGSQQRMCRVIELRQQKAELAALVVDGEVQQGHNSSSVISLAPSSAIPISTSPLDGTHNDILQKHSRSPSATSLSSSVLSPLSKISASTKSPFASSLSASGKILLPKPLLHSRSKSKGVKSRAPAGNQSAFVCSGDVLSKSSSAEPNAETAASDEITRLATKMCRCGIYLSCAPLQITRCFFRVWLQRVSQHSNAQQQIELSGDTLLPHLLDSMGQPSRRNVPKVPSCSSAHASAIQSDDTPLIAPSSSPCRRNVPRILPLLSAALMHNNCDADAAFQGFLLLRSFLCRFLVMRFISGHVFEFNYCWV